MIRSVMRHLVGLGTRPENDPKHNQKIRLVNQICLFVILIITPHMLLTLYYRATWPTLVQLGAILHLSIAIYLNSRHHFNLARILALVVGNMHIGNMALILGHECGVYFYFSAAIIAPLFFYTYKEAAYTLFFASFTILLAVMTQFLGSDYAPLAGVIPLVQVPPALLTVFFYFSVAGSLATVFAFVFYFYNESSRFEESLAEANRELFKLSETDSLTQLPNKRSFKASLDREWGKGIRSRHPLSVLMADLDYFKKYNDSYGHQAGDRCLAEAARAISRHTREFVDFPARYGGEEFIILMTETGLEDACTVAERIREEIVQLAVPHELNEPDRVVTCSLGVASCVPDTGTDAEEIIRRADKALYVAKEKGRNRVEAG